MAVRLLSVFRVLGRFSTHMIAATAAGELRAALIDDMSHIEWRNEGVAAQRFSGTAM